MMHSDGKSTLLLVVRLLRRRDRVRLGVSVLLILVGTVLEMLSLGLVIPVVQAIASGDRRSSYDWLPRPLTEMEYVTFVQLLMVTLVVVFAVKNVFLFASNYFQQRVQVSINNRITQSLFERYLFQPYGFHLANSSSILVRNIQEYSAAVVGNGIGPALTLLTDVITGIGLFIVVVAVEPLSTAVLVVLFGASSLFILRLSRSRTRRWGPERLKFRGVMLEAQMAGFGGIKEIKLFGRDAVVLEAHREGLRRVSRTYYLFAMLQSAPRAFFEVVAILGIASIVILATLQQQSLEKTTLVVALFGVVAFRMLPSVNRILQAIQQLSIGRAGIVGAYEGLSLVAPRVFRHQTSQRSQFKEVELSCVKFKYSQEANFAIDIEQFAICAGEAVGIIGPSGSGKSTLTDLLLGLLSPTEGLILVNGEDIFLNVRNWQDRIGYVPQHVFLLDTSIRKNVAFGIPDQDIDHQRVEAALRQANLMDFVNSTPHGLETMVGERGVKLSGGQRQRLGIARALYAEPEVIVLDEATSALDEETEREIVESFRLLALERTLIIVAHRVSTLKYCSRIVRMDQGTIVQEGTFQEVVGSLSESTDKGQ